MKNILPKVGIRPIVDARCKGVRESVEEDNKKAAINLKKYIEKNIFHPSGEKVECIISSGTIGNFAEASKCDQEFQKHNIGLVISVTNCWCYGLETIDLTPGIPKAIWGINGTERPGAVYLAAAAAAHDQVGDPVFTIYGEHVREKGAVDVTDDVKPKIDKFVKAGLAVATMKNKSYLSIGGISMGIAGSMIDAHFLLDYLGLRTEVVDMSEVKRRLEKDIFDAAEYEKAKSWVRANCPEGKDYNDKDHEQSRSEKDKAWDDSIKMALIFRDLMIGNKKLKNIDWKEEAAGHNAIAAGFQGQRQWTDFMANGDFAEAILNTSFDWNGARSPMIVATENDVLNGISMLFNHLVSGVAQQFSDVRTFWSLKAIHQATSKHIENPLIIDGGGVIHLSNSGPTALDYTGAVKNHNGEPIVKNHKHMTKEDIDACLKETKWCTGLTEYFRGGGWSSQFTTTGDMPITMTRINLVKGLGPMIQIAEGWLVNVSDDISSVLVDRTNPSWPTGWFVPRLVKGDCAFDSVYDLMDKWGANHGAISYGHIGADLITMSSMLRIPVALHNVPREDIFRPKTWNAFGTKSMEGADFRACENFGPLYGKGTKK